jgi:hypothetical protein
MMGGGAFGGWHCDRTSQRIRGVPPENPVGEPESRLWLAVARRAQGRAIGRAREQYTVASATSVLAHPEWSSERVCGEDRGRQWSRDAIGCQPISSSTLTFGALGAAV